MLKYASDLFGYLHYLHWMLKQDSEVTFAICHPTLLIFGDKWLQKIGAVQNSFALCMHTMIFIFINDM